MYASLETLGRSSSAVSSSTSMGVAAGLHIFVLTCAVLDPPLHAVAAHPIALELVPITIIDPPREPPRSQSSPLTASESGQLRAVTSREEAQISAKPPSHTSESATSAPESPVDTMQSPTEGSFTTSTSLDGAALAGSGASASAPQGGGNTGAHGDGSTGPAGPRLRAKGNPCAGYFPWSETAPRGEVKVTVEVTPQGRVAKSQVLAVTPSNSTFSQAALACAAHLRFFPATTSEGTPTAGRTTLVLQFTRN